MAEVEQQAAAGTAQNANGAADDSPDMFGGFLTVTTFLVLIAGFVAGLAVAGLVSFVRKGRGGVRQRRGPPRDGDARLRHVPRPQGQRHESLRNNPLVAAAGAVAMPAAASAAHVQLALANSAAGPSQSMNPLRRSTNGGRAGKSKRAKLPKNAPSRKEFTQLTVDQMRLGAGTEGSHPSSLSRV